MRLVIAATVAAIGLAGCGDDGGSSRADATSEATASGTSTPAPVSGDAILIETRITDARGHIGEVLDGSVLGEAAFCPGGESNGSSEGPTITTTFTCAGGTLTVQYAPPQPSLVQSAAWVVVRGTGRFDGLRGGGSMVAAFETDNPDAGREIFTGTVGS